MSIRRAAFGAAAIVLAGATAMGALAQTSKGDGWYQWRGPDRTGHAPDKDLLKTWPTEGPKLAWKATGLGGGNSTPTIAQGRIFGMSYQGQDEMVWAVSEKDGSPIWKTKIGSANFNIARQAHDGSGGSVTVDGALIYAIGAAGDFVCMEAAHGKVLWKKNFVSDFGGKVPKWGYTESPLVDGGVVVVTPGGAGATMVAFNKVTGNVVWKW